MISFRNCARLSVVAVILISCIRPTLHPRRWSPWDLAEVAPVLVCAVVASIPSRHVDFRTRARAGLYLALALLLVVNDDRNLVQDSLTDIACRNLALIIAFPLIFVAVTHGVSHLFQHRTQDRDTCRKCAYNLTGNTSGICPECGTPVSSVQRCRLGLLSNRETEQ